MAEKQCENAQPAEVEVYTDERLAEFILNGAVDSEDYVEARREVEGMGLNPDDILHEPPAVYA
ncbi:MAG: hypothetical protein GF320_17960 [Armatimonadia bacterium]|nr:hypothetical protein [Armatimonadia bacterium]